MYESAKRGPKTVPCWNSVSSVFFRFDSEIENSGHVRTQLPVNSIYTPSCIKIFPVVSEKNVTYAHSHIHTHPLTNKCERSHHKTNFNGYQPANWTVFCNWRYTMTFAAVKIKSVHFTLVNVPSSKLCSLFICKLVAQDTEKICVDWLNTQCL